MGQYRETIARTKVWLSTLSIGNIVNPRYFEVMASGTTVLACNRENMGAYKGLGLEDDVNVIMFSSLDELYKKVLDLCSNDAKRSSIIEKARELVLKRHTYSLRAEQWTAQVVQDLARYRERLWADD